MNPRDLAVTPRSRWLRRWIGPIAGLLAGLVVSRWRNRWPRDRAAAPRATAADNDPTAHTPPARDPDLTEPDANSRWGRRPLFIAGVVRDVTERHFAKSVRESEEGLQSWHSDCKRDRDGRA